MAMSAMATAVTVKTEATWVEFAIPERPPEQAATPPLQVPPAVPLPPEAAEDVSLAGLGGVNTRHRWSTTLLSVFDDKEVCWTGTWYPCYLYAEVGISPFLEERKTLVKQV
jgi:hypothetical protein